VAEQAVEDLPDSMMRTDRFQRGHRSCRCVFARDMIVLGLDIVRNMR